ncbi:hypothetical protein HYT05_03625 [Candidatus Kaiserbacteria bacterium]|nr:hypothetical protein [Candidatus Kaiserbacteria bacterium]
MPIIEVFVMPAVIGALCGYFLRVEVLAALALALVVFVGYQFATAREIEVMIAFIFAVQSCVGVFAALATSYSITGQTWIGEFFRKHILR